MSEGGRTYMTQSETLFDAVYKHEVVTMWERGMWSILRNDVRGRRGRDGDQNRLLFPYGVKVDRSIPKQ